MITISMLIQYGISLICAVVSGVVLWKLQDNRKDNDLKHSKQVEAAVHDRELLLAISEVSEMTARKVSGDNINGELHDAVDELVEKRNEVTKFTNKEFFNYMKK